jgi:hypothetical protein
MLMKKIIVSIGLLACLGITFYYDTSTAFLSSEFRSSILYSPNEVEAIAITEQDVETDAEVDPTDSIIPSLEYIFESQEEVDGYMIETYREYEIYRDENGDMIKKVPTSHFDFLKYKK